jgi:uncharacterized protein YjbI with pentapeptide repeats
LLTRDGTDDPSAHDITGSGYSSLEAIKSNGGDFFAVHLNNCHIYGLTLNSSVFHNVNFEDCVFINTGFTNVYLRNVTVKNVSYVDYLWCNGKVTDKTIKHKEFENTTDIDPEEPMETYDHKWLRDEKARIASELENLKNGQKGTYYEEDELLAVKLAAEGSPTMPPLKDIETADHGAARVMAGWYALAAEAEKKNGK